MLPEIDFSKIRTYKTSKRDAFEELTAQVFCEEYECENSTYSRIEGAGGDGGVEAYWTHEDDSKTAFQAKYFNGLKSSQWTQLKKSIETAFKNHPSISTYVVAVPLDRTPDQIVKWDGMVKKISQEREAENLHVVNFIWWGASELLNIFTEDQHRSKVVYWFGVEMFNIEWLKNKNRASISLLDRRYSPDQHISTQAGDSLAALAWSERSQDEIKNGFVKLHAQADDFISRLKGADSIKSNDAVIKILTAIKLLCSYRFSLEHSYIELYKNVALTKESGDELHECLYALNEDSFCEESPLGPYEKLRSSCIGFLNEVDVFNSILNKYYYADLTRLVLTGDAGIGKSHLLADLVTSITDIEQPALLLIGERFTTCDTISIQIQGMLNWNKPMEHLYGALNELAKLKNKPALICIDALNEAEDRKLWKSHIIAFSEELEKYPWITLLVSCRKDFLSVVLPKPILKNEDGNWGEIEHYGFGNELACAVQKYFEIFNITSRQLPPILPEFRNPLFLRTFCEAFEGKEIPEGTISLKSVMDLRVGKFCDQMLESIDCDPVDSKRCIQWLAERIAANAGNPIDSELARNEVNKCHPYQGVSKSLYRHLISSGLVVENAVYDSTAEGYKEKTRFSFERFSDYFIAERILDKCPTIESLQKNCEIGGRIYSIFENYTSNRGVGKALSILIPEGFNVELINLVRGGYYTDEQLEDFLDSLVWRSNNSFSEATDNIISECIEREINVFPYLLRSASIPDHRYNAEWLHKYLSSVSLVERDQSWTIFLTDQLRYSGRSRIVEDVLNWTANSPTEKLSGDQATLITILLIWMCSANDEGLRDQASKVAILVMTGRLQEMKNIVSAFTDCNDPYVRERLYAICAGVSMRNCSLSDLDELSRTVHKAVFDKDEVEPNAYIREYAKACLDACAYRGGIQDLDVSSYSPPYQTLFPAINDSRHLQDLKDNEGWRRIVYSLQPESSGHYGDFGRYVMGYRVRQFSNKLLSENPSIEKYGNDFNDQLAMDLILQRVCDLGWCPEMFLNYERDLFSEGRDRSKIERVSKKYQWIALNELIGYLSDHYHLNMRWNDTYQTYQGLWQICSRNFDPSLEINSDSNLLGVDPTYCEALFSDKSLCRDRNLWVTSSPPDFMPLINSLCNDSKEDDWVTLHAHLNFKEDAYAKLEVEGLGDLSMWSEVRSYLMPKAEKNNFINLVSNKSFWGEGCEYPSISSGWIGEFPWGGMIKNSFKNELMYGDRWFRDLEQVNPQITICKISERGKVLPSLPLTRLMQLSWSGKDHDLINKSGELMNIYLNREDSESSRPLLINKKALTKSLKEHDLEIVWCCLSEKMCYDLGHSRDVVGKRLLTSAVYHLDESKLAGGITHEDINDFSDNN